jgi:hypothetical protein
MTPTRSTEADKNYTTAGAGCDLSPARVDNTTVEAAPPIVVSMGGSTALNLTSAARPALRMW